MRLQVFIFLIIIFSAFGIISPVSAQDGGDEATVLTAYKRDGPITIDGVASEEVWSFARPLYIRVKDGGIGTVDVEVKALYDEEHIYLYTRWPDTAENASKGIWTYNATNRTWTTSQNEDRISFMWNINDSIRTFNIAGCIITCHGDQKYTEYPEGEADMWHWKAARTNPVGYCDDKFLNNTLSPYEGGEDKLVARYGDDKLRGGYVRNTNEDGSGPKYYEPAPENGRDALFILQSEIDDGEAVKIEPGTVFNEDDSVPGYILEKPEGSRGDIQAMGSWQDGYWEVEFKRKLVTGNAHDVQFDTSHLYRFGIAVMDNEGGFESHGRGHSFEMDAKTLEFGGLGQEEVAKMGLVKDYLTTAKAYVARGETGLAASEINYAIVLFQESKDQVALVDPALYLEIKDHFTQAKRIPTVENIDDLIEEVDSLIATLQGKRVPPEATLVQTFLVIWGTVQVYVFILLAALASFPLYRAIKIGQKKVFKKMSILLFLVMAPIFLEGLGRLGALLGISFLHSFSFMTSEFATLLWAWLMFLALFFARAGFGEIDKNIHLLEEHRAILRVKVRERTREVEETKKFLESVFNGIGEGVVVLDRDYNIISVNKAYQEMVNRPEDEVLGAHCYEMSHLRDTPCSDKEHHCPVRETFSSKKPSQALHTHYDKDGNEIFVEVSSYPLMDSSGNVKYVIESVIDITDKKRLEIESLKAKDEIITQMKRHEDYVFDVADGLRNPLQVFMNHLEEFDTTNFTGEQKRSYDVILEALRLVELNIKRLTKREELGRDKKP